MAYKHYVAISKIVREECKSFGVQSQVLRHPPCHDLQLCGLHEDCWLQEGGEDEEALIPPVFFFFVVQEKEEELAT